jgi:hypothetical protein
MSVIWGNSENMYSVRVLLLVTQTGPRPRCCRTIRWVGILQRTLARRKWDFRWSWSPFKLTFHLSVGSPSTAGIA